MHYTHVHTSHLAPSASSHYVAADMMRIAQDGFSPEHNGWDAYTTVQLSSFLDTTGVPAVNRADAPAGDVVHTFMCKASFDGPCRLVQRDDSCFAANGPCTGKTPVASCQSWCADPCMLPPQHSLPCLVCIFCRRS